MLLIQTQGYAVYHLDGVTSHALLVHYKGETYDLTVHEKDGILEYSPSFQVDEADLAELQEAIESHLNS